MKELVEKYYDESLKEVLKEYPDLLRAVQEQGRKELFVNNMVKQLRVIEKKRSSDMQPDGTFKVNLTREKIKGLVKDFVKVIAQAVIKMKEKEIRSKDSKQKIFLPKMGKGIQMTRVKNRVTPGGIILPNGFKM